ncbi:MAG: FHA domain-containing protein [Phocaeicola sp.]
MATKKCNNGHQYDSNIYGENCPFCPSAQTKQVSDANDLFKTRVSSETNASSWEAPTIPMSEHFSANGDAGATVIRHLGSSETNPAGASGGNRKLVALLVSYTTHPLGELYKIYEGRNTIGRASQADITLTNDSNISGQHLLILYREAEGVFWAADQNSSNGSYVNNKFVSDRVQLKTNDVITLGATQMVFIAIPQL